MSMELDSSKYEDGEVAGLEYGSPERLYKEDKIDDFEDEKIDVEENTVDTENGDGHDNNDMLLIKDKGKSRDSGKYRNKDRKRGRREEKDQKSKDRDRLKERDKAYDALKEKAVKESETRDKDHISSRERRKEEIEVQKDKERNKDKFREKDYDRDKHRDKDRERDEGREREHERGKDRGRERQRDQEIEKERSVERDYERGKEKDRGKERERDREIEKERSVERDYERGKERGKEREKDNEKIKGRDRDREIEKERSVERDYERGKEKDRGREREIEKERSVERDYERGKERGREREKDNEKIKGRDRDREKVDREWDRDRVKEKDREREKERDRTKDREREREKGKDREKEREKERDKDWDRLEREKAKEKFKEKEKEKARDKYWEKDRDKERSKDRGREKVSGKNRDEGYEISRGKEREKDEQLKVDHEDGRDVINEDKDIQNCMIDIQERVGSKDEKLITEKMSDLSQPSTSELQDRITKMKEERLKKNSEGAPEVLAWVNKSRKLEERRNAEKEKALLLSKVFEEQDNIDQGDSEEEEGPQHTGKDLGGVKIMHGLDKVMEGGAVILTLKDQNILADGDINEDVDMLENMEISEQKMRDGAYNAAKKKTGIYTDKFSDDPGSQKKILPQYDDPVEDEGVTLDESGRFTGEAEKKLEELRKRIQGANSSKHLDDLASAAKTSSDYYTQEEMLQFKKPKKKKSLRKREKLDLDALEAEAVAAGLGAGDLGSRNEGKRQSAREEQEKADVEMRSNAYQAAYAKAEEASKALRHEQTLTVKDEEDGNLVFGDEDEDLYRSLDKARKLALKKQVEQAAAAGPQAVALLAVADKDTEDSQNPHFGDPQEKRLVFTEMEEFVSKIKLDEDAHKPETENVFEEDDEPKSVNNEKDEGGGWMEVNENDNDELHVTEEKEEPVPDITIHEPAVGKGLSGALQLLKERGTLKETVDWGGRNMDKKKSKLVGIYENDGTKEIRIERTDEFGRIMTPKEAFRMISHKFHGKGPGKMKIEKRMKQFHEELKLKQMKASDTPSLSMERMREAQAQLKTPYLVLSGHVKPGQTSDPRSGFATVEKDHPGSLTPMLGDRKVEHFLGLKRKAEPTDMGPPKKPKT